MYRVLLLAVFLIMPTIQESEPILPTPPIVDERPNPVDLSNGINVNSNVEGGEVDVGAKRAAVEFEKLYHLLQKEGFRTHLSHYVLNVNPDTEDVNNTLLEEWRISRSLLGELTYTLVLTTTNAYDTENPLHVQLIHFQCKYEDYVEHMLCIPDKCSLDPFEATPTPGVICAYNYRQSQKTLTTIYEASHTTDQVDLADGLYESTIDCMKEKIEKLKISGNIECYYKGFEPENIVSYEEMNKALIDEGWKRLEDGTYERKSIVEEKSASALVDENNMTVVETA